MWVVALGWNAKDTFKAQQAEKKKEKSWRESPSVLANVVSFDPPMPGPTPWLPKKGSPSSQSLTSVSDDSQSLGLSLPSVVPVPGIQDGDIQEVVDSPCKALMLEFGSGEKPSLKRRRINRLLHHTHIFSIYEI